VAGAQLSEPSLPFDENLVMADEAYQYPPDLLNLLVETVPLICKSKRDVVLFFAGAGVQSAITARWSEALIRDPSPVSKYEIARAVLVQLNEGGDRLLRQRREVIKRIVEFEDFEGCWPNDRLKAEGLVARVRTRVNKKDAFTRMDQERERERTATQAARRAELERQAARRTRLQELRTELGRVLGMKDPAARGRALEKVLNSIFQHYKIGVREAFAISGEAGGTVEQIDGVIELDGEIYLVEVKAYSERLERLAVDRHVSRLFSRAEARGLIISGSGFTSAARAAAADALAHKVVVLCDLEEIVLQLEAEADLTGILREKIRAAVVDRNPYSR